MEKLIMERRAYDNKYLHRDFHASTDNAIAYIAENFGEKALDNYLLQYVNSRYDVMTLAQLEQYFIDLFEKEEASDALTTILTDNKLNVKIGYCPALSYLNANGGASEWYHKTTTTMYPYLADKCGLGFELVSYDKNTGKAEFNFLKLEK